MQFTRVIENAQGNFFPPCRNRSIDFGSLRHLLRPSRRTAHEFFPVSKSAKEISSFIGGLLRPRRFQDGMASVYPIHYLHNLFMRRHGRKQLFHTVHVARIKTNIV